MNTPETLPMRAEAIQAYIAHFESIGADTYIKVNTFILGCEIPQEYIDPDGAIVLNISPRTLAPKSFVCGDSLMTFACRFNGIEAQIRIPLNAIMAVWQHNDPSTMVLWSSFDLPDAPERQWCVEGGIRKGEIHLVACGEKSNNAPVGVKGWRPTLVKPTKKD